MLEPDPGAEATQESIIFFELVEGFDNTAVQQRKIACIQRHGNIRRGAEEPIKYLVRHLKEARGYAFYSDAVHYVESLAPALVETLDEFRRVLQIAIQQDYGVACRDTHSAGEGILRSEIARVPDYDYFVVSSGQIGQHLVGVIGTGVVDENDLVVDADFGEDSSETLVIFWRAVCWFIA